jgi:putative tributyrin esterase
MSAKPPAADAARGDIPFRTIERSDPAFTPEGLEFFTVKSRALRQRADITLFAPAPTIGLRDVPIVILLHGAYGSHWAWPFKGGAHRTAARLIEEGALPPLVLAMPSDGLWGDGSGYVTHDRIDFERWILDEVPALAVHAVEGCTSASPLLIAGLSMGGFGALTLAGKHPARFAAAAGHSLITEASQLDPLIEESREGWSDAPGDTSILAALAGASEPLPPIRFDCGTDDFLLPANRALHEALDARGIAHAFVERPGGHDWAYWSRELEATLRFFGTVLNRGKGGA